MSRLRGKPFFFYFNNDEQPYSLCNVIKDWQNKFIVGYDYQKKDRGIGKMYSAFDNFDDFWEYFIQFTPNERLFYEIITVHQKMYFDIDIKLTTFKNIPDEHIEEADDLGIDVEDFDGFGNQLVSHLMNKIVEAYQTLFDIQLKKNDILIYSSHSDVKRSYHVVVDNYYCIDHYNCKMIYNQVMEDCPAVFKIFIDDLYKSVQNFRLLYNTKFGDTRFKKVCAEQFGEYDPDVVYSVKDALFHSLSVMTEYCKELPDIGHHLRETNESFQVLELDQETITGAMVKAVPACYKILKSKENTLILKRLYPDMCHVCDRVHEHENASVFYSPHIGGILFRCWRNEKAKLVFKFTTLDDDDSEVRDCPIDVEEYIWAAQFRREKDVQSSLVETKQQTITDVELEKVLDTISTEAPETECINIAKPTKRIRSITKLLDPAKERARWASTEVK